MEAFLQLLSLLLLPYHCQTRPGARVGDEPKAANEAAEFKTSFPADVIELTSASPPAAVTLEDGRYVWGAVDVEAEAPAASVDDYETLFEVSAVSAAALVSASSDVIELTSASPPAPVTLDDGRWSWGAVARHRLDRVPV